mmetsp:Transcript_72030/g.201041  ORF Transcript_72030/g.201041 Transcript_72030/m.201041 type:complete len:317 (-) Transcript_72030:255-1205(-)
MEGILPDVGNVAGRGHVVRQASHGDRLAAVVLLLPLAEQVDQHVRLEAPVQQLREEVQIRHERRLQDDGDVRGVEQLDRIGPLLAADLLVLHTQVHTEALEVNHDEEHQDGGKQVGQVRGRLSVEGLSQGCHLVAPRRQEVEGRHDGAFELRALACVHRRGRKRLPDNALTDVGSDEQRDPRTNAVSLLHELVQKQHDHARKEQLEDDQEGVPRAELAEVPVHAAHDVGYRLAHGDEHAEKLLSPVEQVAVLLQALVHVDDAAARQQLHDHARGDDRRDAELHQAATVGRQNHPHPVEGVRGLRCHDAVQRDLAAN